MKRRTFLAAASAAGMASTLAACSNGDTQQSTTELSKDTTAELTLFYWDKAQTPTIEDNIAAFNKEYPNIKVTPSVAVYADYWTKLRTQAQGDQLPDVMWMNGPNFQLYAGNGMLADVEDVADVAWDKYPSALVDLYTLDGKKYGIPKDYDTVACFINKDVFTKAGLTIPENGWTWEEHNQAAKAIKDSGVVPYGVVVGLSDSQVSYYNTIYQAGGYVIKDGKSGYDDPKSMAGIQFWLDRIADGSMPPMEVTSDTPAEDLFKSGQAGILWGGSWQVKPLREVFPGDEVVVVPLPKGEQEASIIHGLSYAASAKSKNLAAAKALVKAMTTQTANETEAKNGTAIPAFAETQQAWLDQAASWKLDVFTTAAETYAVPYPASKNTAAWSDKQIILNDVFTSKISLEEGCKQLTTEMNTALEQEQG
ncbi:MAG: sugar ABC transporter substrate-binding protein [Propionibacteriaceae bacterium]|nr:sugar ABC transporter substrate-binding protein [Propionibacteriaceae bacterium]